MKKLLVPTDFSDNAFLAAQYAAELCQKQKYSLHLIHFYTATSSAFDDAEQQADADESDLLKADITIKDWADRLEALYPGLLISFHNERGLLDEGLPKEAAREGYAAIVMGTTGVTADKNIFWGSNTALITAKAPIPVIAVPNRPIEHTVNKVGLLTNFNQEELLTLHEFTHIFKDSIDLSLIHVYKESDSEASISARLDSWLFNIREFSAVRHIDKLIAPIVKDDKDLDTIPEVVAQLIEENQLDIILISKSRKTFFERLFTPSVSKAITLALQKPAFFGKTV
ncbi:universal stress protein [Sphingobacterium paludis]|uniref:Nucleotide-binding universal stress UspA family protein n=1 Tax=Sphingobacterium paludis TaxID=1476465 RepID=A0A4R7D5P0_9SPHI|nr:universal stress protein [Sphingobacterium paludis]TDS16220.1 nucleotide-binding universal stress UspA family protein [Sphingobacterium paludis]